MQLTVPNNESGEHTPILRDHRARFQALTPASSPPGAKHHGLRPVASRSSLSRRSSNISSRFFQPRASEYDAADNGLYASVGARQWYADYTTIDWLHDVVKDGYRKAHLQQLKGVRGHLVNSWDAVQGYLLVAIIGIVTAAIAYCIDVTESLLFDLKTGYCTSNILVNKHACCAGSSSEACGEWANWSQSILETGSESFEYCIYILFAVIFAVSASLLTMTTASERPSGKIFYLAAGSGIPEVKTILSGFVIRGFLGFRTLIVKAVGLTLGVASGLSLGKEGPFVHIACAVGNIFCRLFRKFHFNEGKRRQILSASCAAGVATAFGAPIGGVLFSLEEVSYYFPSKAMWRAFCCAVTAALTLKFLNPHATGELTLLKLDFERSWTGPDLVVYVVIAFIGGIYGALFNNLNTLWTRRIRGLSYIKRHPVLEVLVLVILTSSISYQNAFTRISGTDLVRKLTSPCREGRKRSVSC
ncbi:hypothetical protein G7K_4981-t1 [Saitoella complicata NRRL Y-17804]|uniref:Chloride channel protein n=1 Tax=Saitoella complicata (strain BCRC 22490 / CBS 7301 / JCM 7358 / NBRC 10748 / NRRL Y-17804) TaxID=698492 RepID=A0A0E9NLX3_SAICN|nr:hypothetical protein G7K_4981-t1 [Saitoella complicata NRRL Y-17804]